MKREMESDTCKTYPIMQICYGLMSPMKGTNKRETEFIW